MKIIQLDSFACIFVSCVVFRSNLSNVSGMAFAGQKRGTRAKKLRVSRASSIARDLIGDSRLPSLSRRKKSVRMRTWGELKLLWY